MEHVIQILVPPDAGSLTTLRAYLTADVVYSILEDYFQCSVIVCHYPRYYDDPVGVRTKYLARVYIENWNKNGTPREIRDVLLELSRDDPKIHQRFVDELPLIKSNQNLAPLLTLVRDSLGKRLDEKYGDIIDPEVVSTLVEGKRAKKWERLSYILERFDLRYQVREELHPSSLTLSLDTVGPVYVPDTVGDTYTPVQTRLWFYLSPWGKALDTSILPFVLIAEQTILSYTSLPLVPDQDITTLRVQVRYGLEGLDTRGVLTAILLYMKRSIDRSHDSTRYLVKILALFGIPLNSEELNRT